MFYPLIYFCKQVRVFKQFEIDIDFPSCFGVNDGVKHAEWCVTITCLYMGYIRVETEHLVIAADIFEH
jgi:hypothetical protein